MVALRGDGLSPKAQVLPGQRRRSTDDPGPWEEITVLVRVSRVAAIALALALLPEAAAAAEFDGRSLGLLWALPFAGILLSIALFPLLAPHAWEHHQGKIAGRLGPARARAHGPRLRGRHGARRPRPHRALEYIPFILLLLALFTVAGGIVIRGNIHGAPVANTVLLLIGMVLASFIGTTGASMVMIRPVMRANDDRRHNVHVIVFFIFLVSNIGGSLTPLGDPPLFLGFLRGVDFFWTTTHLLSETLLAGAIVLAVFSPSTPMSTARKAASARSDAGRSGASSAAGSTSCSSRIIGAILMSATAISAASPWSAPRSNSPTPCGHHHGRGSRSPP
jgi:hypothetical protein